MQKLYLYNNSLSGTIPDSINALSVKKGLENPPYVETPIFDNQEILGSAFPRFD
ncbi:MAG: hypothetical protein GDA38_02475 [Hormoscilla sp. SP12CHS1]|nr:hypothetical protein [Hormoscilla sp. SP12CHS1]